MVRCALMAPYERKYLQAWQLLVLSSFVADEEEIVLKRMT
jgi:hypothetical protein